MKTHEDKGFAERVRKIANLLCYGGDLTGYDSLEIAAGREYLRWQEERETRS